MGKLIIQKEGSLLSPKASSLRYLRSLGVPTPTTLIVPLFSPDDHVELQGIEAANKYYARLSFHDNSVKRRAGQVVDARYLEAYIRELASLSDRQAADLIVQPFIVPTYSGAALKLGDTLYTESAYGIAPTLFHKGRCSYRAILKAQELVYWDTLDQGLALLCLNNSIQEVEESGWPNYHPEGSIFEIAAILRNIDNILVEWSVADGSLVFFDHKNLSSSGAFLQLRATPPALPSSVTTTIDEVQKARSTKSVVFFDYPDLSYLPQAQQADYVVIRAGAMLSHLSVYSTDGHYRCVFGDLGSNYKVQN